MKLININKKINNNKILNNINMEFKPNKITALIGRNGSGKTSLIKILANLSLPTSGEINADKLNNANMSVVFDGTRYFYQNLTVMDNFFYFAGLKGIKKKDVLNFFKNNIDYFEVNNLLNKKIRELSLGQKQYVSLLISIINKPKFLLLDEPSNGLDFENLLSLSNLLKKIKLQNKVYILITSHDINFLSKVADEFYFIEKGEIVGDIKTNVELNILENFYKTIIKSGGNKL